MNITWHENPLRTSITLNDNEKEILRLKIRIKYLEDAIFTAKYRLDAEDINKVLECLNPYMNGKTYLQLAVESLNIDLDEELDKWVDDRLKLYIDELENGSHAGDCTCFPCSCFKCHAESLIGVDTIKGLGKHPGSYVERVFRDKENLRLDQAIENLKNDTLEWSEDKVKFGWKSKEDYDKYIPTWNAQKERAITWLEEYRFEHFAAKGV